jgi:hypothetical protein
MPGSWPAQDFPLLNDNEWAPPPSPPTHRYNCIAWSVGRTDRKWWPDQWGVEVWFPGQPRHSTIENFIAGYRSVGYAECADGALEDGVERIALYAKSGILLNPMPTHVAYQLENGNWTSKLGDFEDIEHFKAEILHGPQYGTIIRYMSRPRQPRPSPPTY